MKHNLALIVMCFLASKWLCAYINALCDRQCGRLRGARPDAFAVIDADIYFRSDGGAIFATPAALETTPGAYDLESLLAHELGHVFGPDHSGVWRSKMAPFAPASGTFAGDRPTTAIPDAPLADDDRAGLRSLYADWADTVDIGYISGRVLPANLFALADFPATSPGQNVTGIFGAQVVAFDVAAGSVIAASLSGWSCDPLDAIVHFDGSYTLGPLPISRSYVIYAEPFTGLIPASSIAGATTGKWRKSMYCTRDKYKFCGARAAVSLFGESLAELQNDFVQGCGALVHRVNLGILVGAV